MLWSVDSRGSPSARKETSLVLDSVDGIQECTIHDEEEVLAPNADSLEEECGKESKIDVTQRPKRRKLVSNSEDWYSSKEIAVTKMNTSSSGNDVIEDTSRGVSTNPIHSTDDLMKVDDEDAICKRTRALYSLANFSLDELETFLQETDDEEDLHNVDDEQEYRKFLTAVLQGGENEGQSIQEDENVYDEDEDSDVDFEIELEKALDSDHDESIRGKKNGGRGVGCRPKTRQNNHNEKKFLVFSLSVLDPYRQQIAMSDGSPKIYPSLLSVDASSSGQKEALGKIPMSHSCSPFGTRVNNGGHDDSLQTTKDSLWLPQVSGPILSILDVAPL
ncbi:Homeodomain-like superfamily protein [Thalictrum thalictroides]|uniref:Homeodomain-like superfamily protein n=1 Tax=Thalictrum thalictroides TaxID=46969 RepID=A0A7J6UUH9_THATH|nr:Homeodomain-like superfamily protein [Thalictrum thalictroides]